jgi:hydroxyethylthiazole kinase-like uncharacterized protein yjeF
MEPVFTPAEMTEIDRAAPDFGASLATLMESAGRAVARAVRRRYRPCRTLVLVGSGNNGGDGYVAARHLAEAGWPVAVAALAPPRPGSAAAGAAARWHGPILPFSAAEAIRADLVIDAVFGAGLARDLTDEVAEVLQAARRLVAIDMPSGIDGATGALRGKPAKAECTVTFVALKPGHLLHPGRGLCGAIILADIGMPEAALRAVTPRCFRNTPGLWHLPQEHAGDHKYTRGHVTILSGSLAGASVLAAMGARRVGAGLVTLAAAHPPEAPYGIMRRMDPLAELIRDERRKVWLCGPGLGVEPAGEALAALTAAGKTVIADADALTACAGAPERLRGCAVITPHAGEFSRVFGPAGTDRLAAARAAAARCGAVVVLKGADTIIAAPDGRGAINDHASPALATGGTGDTLAGIIAGLLGQGMPAFEAAAAAVWLHGDAALRIGPGLIAEDIADHLPAAMAEARQIADDLPAKPRYTGPRAG